MIHNTVRKLIDWLALLTVMGGLAMTLTVAYWLLFPYTPLVINGQPKVLQEEGRAGDYVLYQIDYCKYIDIPVTVKRRFVDGLVYTIPEFTTSSNHEGCRVQTVLIDVPKGLPEGDYYFYTEFVYKVNPIREIVVSVESSSFKVLNAE